MSCATITKAIVCTTVSLTISVNAAEMALVPVGASGSHMIIGNEIILIGGGQEVTLEIRVSDWDPSLLRVWQGLINTDGFTSGSAGTAFPLGWNRPFVRCVTDADCPSDRICHITGMCADPDELPEAGLFTDTSRPDYVFSDVLELSAVDLIGYRAGSTAFNWEESVPYVSPPKYCATLILAVSDDAAGTFTIELQTDAEGHGTFLTDPFLTHIGPLNRTPALITIASSICGNRVCEPDESVATCPIDCRRTPMFRSIQPGGKRASPPREGSGADAGVDPKGADGE